MAATIDSTYLLDRVSKEQRKLSAALSTPRRIMQGSTSANCMFRVVDGKVLKLSIQSRTADVLFTWNTGQVDSAPPRIDVELSAATESDLIEARGAAPDHERGKIDVLLRILRDGAEPPKPLQIQIVNPKEIGGQDRVVTISRDDAGKLSGLLSLVAPFSET